MKPAIYIFIFLLSFTELFSQNSATLYQNYSEFAPLNSRKLYFRLENIDFLKNNEYTGDMVKGYTLIGSWMRPKLVYYPSEKLRIESGGHFLKYQGREEFDHVSFWFNTHYRLFNELSVVFGNLNNNANHHLIRPLFEPEQYLTEKPEAGIQFLFNNRWLSSDLWLNWEQFILSEDPFQEHFTFGWSSDFQLWSRGLSRIGIPLQLIISHKGGQIDTSEEPVQTIRNNALGISFSRDLTSPVLKQWSITAWYTSFKDASGTKKFAYDKGNGLLLEAYIDSRYGRVTGNYWNAHQYIAPKGMELFQSVSTKIPGHSVTDREIISLNYDINKQVMRGANFGFSLETHYDLRAENLSYVWGFFFTFNESFFIYLLP